MDRGFLFPVIAIGSASEDDRPITSAT